MHSELYKRLVGCKAWRELRAAWLTEHPLCESCKKKGLLRSARCVHHITPVESGRTDEDCTRLCYSPANLMSLCYECHSEIHKAERSHSKAMHQQRARERLEQWIARHSRPPGV